MKFIIFLFLISTTIVFADIKWSKLLHHKDNINQIVSKEFYISENIHIDPSLELLETITALKSKNGFDIACNFPARYTYLKSKYKNIPEFDLGQCRTLNQFFNSFPKEKVNIVFTSEYSNNPSSAFGHTMLLFSDNEKSLEIGDAVHFAAKTSKKDNFFEYSYKGFNGKYNGYFTREPFYKKIYEYNILEQRYMYIYELNFTKKQVKNLIYHLFELKKAKFRYFFLDGNCATRTTDILDTVTNHIRNSKTYYLPIDTIYDYQNFIVRKERFIPLVNKLNLLLAKMSKDEKKLFNTTIQNHSNTLDKHSDIVKEALVYHATFNFRRYHNIYKNYNSVMSEYYIKEDIQDNSENPLDKIKPSHFSLGLLKNHHSDYLNIQYRPLFLDLYDIQNNAMQQSQINTLTWDINLKQDNIKINKLDLANIKSFVNQTSFYKPISWSLYSGLNRENKKNNLKFNNEIGIGRSSDFNISLNSSFLLYVGFDNTNIYIKPYLSVSTNINQYFKIGFSSFLKTYHNYNENELFISKKYNNFIYQIKYNNTNGENKDSILFNIKYNF